jgi:hypothetical protein
MGKLDKHDLVAQTARRGPAQSAAILRGFAGEQITIGPAPYQGEPVNRLADYGKATHRL